MISTWVWCDFEDTILHRRVARHGSPCRWSEQHEVAVRTPVGVPRGLQVVDPVAGLPALRSTELWLLDASDSDSPLAAELRALLVRSISASSGTSSASALTRSRDRVASCGPRALRVRPRP